MNHEIDMKNYTVRTDLIVDTFDTLDNSNNIKIDKQEFKDITVTDIDVLNNKNSLNKKKGKYITISFKDVTDKDNKKQLQDILITNIKKMLSNMNIAFNDKALIIGLGNISSTPDALGPKTAQKVLVTKYLFDNEQIGVSSNYRNTSSFIPGVLATTGMESSDMIKGIIKESKPDFLIVIDALASSSIDRVNKTIQMTDSGIYPGSGVGNHRKEISKEVLNIPVLSIGIPTVIEAIVLVSDTIKYMCKHLSYNKDNYNKNKLIPITNRDYSKYDRELTTIEKQNFLGQVGLLSEQEVKELLFEVLTPIHYNMMVTPKEIDFLIDQLSDVLANSINCALHKKFDI